MYVIYPAEELIYMTYGVAVPKIKPRPTLDNLREPAVPIPTRSHNLREPVVPIPTRPYKQRNDSNASQQANFSTSECSTRSTTSGRSIRNITPQNTETDIFGYASTNIEQLEENDNLNAQQQHQHNIESSHPINASTSNSSSKTPVKSKHKLQLRLGRLGRTKQNQKPEPARSRDITEIRIANPAFTRENLQQRNFDAFFESGVPVYSLEKREPT